MTPMPPSCAIAIAVARLGDRVHRGAEQRDVERMRARQLRRDVGVAREDLGRGRDQQDVVEGEPLSQVIERHRPSSWNAKGPPGLPAEPFRSCHGVS